MNKEKILKAWQEKKEFLKLKQQIKQQKRQIKGKDKKKELTTTKFLMFFLFISCSIIEIFTFIVTIISVLKDVYDFTALQMLITAVVGEVIGFAIYSLKSLKENTKGGIVYDMAFQEKQSFLTDEENEQEAQG